MKLIKKTLLVVGAALFALTGTCANAVTFNIVYDDLGGNNAIDTVIGTGTFSYDGSLTFGAFALNSLTGITFDASFNNGHTFSTADITTNPSTSGIDVFDLGGGLAGLVFTGSGGGVIGGSLDLAHGTALGTNFLSHEPTNDIANPVGCCGGNGVINEYQEFTEGGGAQIRDYQATAAITVPEPASIALLGIGLAGLGLSRRKR